MAPQEILEGNKLIAEFMGYTKREGQLPNVWWRFTGVSYQPVFEDEEMKFHEDWNQLEEVLERIQGTDKCNLIVKIITSPTISGKWLSHKLLIQESKGLFDNPLKTLVEQRSNYEINESKISTVFKGVVAFIKQYKK